jgi:NAD(P)-dependent dehydrogenase (short-subunit alcohol dehydrogenase family)
VVYTDLDSSRTDEAAKAAGPGHLSYALNVADGDAIDRTVETIAQAAGRIDILVNNAGIGVKAGDRKSVDEFPVETWDEMIRIDLTGSSASARAVVPHMKARTSGALINIASVLGLVPMRLQSSYVAAKAGVVNLTRSMALELAPFGILVNGIAPAPPRRRAGSAGSATPRARTRPARAALSHIPLGARPTQEIANGALFLGAPKSSYITAYPAIDGGWTGRLSRGISEAMAAPCSGRGPPARNRRLPQV